MDVSWWCQVPREVCSKVPRLQCGDGSDLERQEVQLPTYSSAAGSAPSRQTAAAASPALPTTYVVPSSNTGFRYPLVL